MQPPVQPHVVQSRQAQRFYRAELDVLRFLAFLCVFISHSLPTPPAAKFVGPSERVWRLVLVIKDSGNFGVCIFFILSSFLITELLRREYEKTGSVHIRAFFLRRMLRIWPLYFAVLLLFIVAGTFYSSFHIEPQRLLAYLLLAGNWYIVFHPLVAGPLSSLWSISVEEQFYGLWPTIAKLGGIRGVAILSTVLIFLSSVTTFLVAGHSRELSVTLWLNSFVQFQFFGVGALMAIFFAGRVPDQHWFTRVAMAALGGGLWLTASGVCLIKRTGVDPAPAVATLGYGLAALGGIFLFLAIFGVPDRFMPKSFIYLGKISYGLYVFHELGFMSVRWIRANVEHFGEFDSGVSWFLFNRSLALGITIALAALSYKYLEEPFLRLKKRFTFVDSRVP